MGLKTNNRSLKENLGLFLNCVLQWHQANGGRKTATEKPSLWPGLAIVCTPPHATFCLRLFFLSCCGTWATAERSFLYLRKRPLGCRWVKVRKEAVTERVMCWTSLDKACCLVRHLKKKEEKKLIMWSANQKVGGLMVKCPWERSWTWKCMNCSEIVWYECEVGMAFIAIGMKASQMLSLSVGCWCVTWYL